MLFWQTHENNVAQILLQLQVVTSSVFCDKIPMRQNSHATHLHVINHHFVSKRETQSRLLCSCEQQTLHNNKNGFHI